MLCNTEFMIQKEKLELTVSVNMCPDLDTASLFLTRNITRCVDQALARPSTEFLEFYSSILNIWPDEYDAANSERGEMHE